VTVDDIRPEHEHPIRSKEEFDRRRALVLERFEEKAKPLAKNLWLVPYLVALYRFMKDADAHWMKKAIAVSALLYFIAPLDAMPDVAPIVGYLDDLGVALAAIRYLGKQLDPYLPF